MKLLKAIDLLLTDKAFIAPRPSITGTERYCIYSGSMIPMMMLSKANMRILKRILVSKQKRWYISRKAIRSLHGNHTFKKHYKSINSKQPC